jgi:hypothetical protein
MKSNIRGFQIVAALATAFFGGVNVASAETFSYTYSVTNEQNINISEPNAVSGGAGQIVLTGSYAGPANGYTGPTPNTILAWCLDIETYLLQNATYTLSGPLTSTTTAAGFPNPSPIVGQAAGTLSATQIGEIGALITHGDAIIAANAAGTYNVSAAIQLAIWEVEYGISGANGTQPFTYTGLDQLNGDLTYTSTQLAAQYITDVTNGTWALDSDVYLLTGSDNQTLAFDTDGPLNRSATPLPAALPLFATSLGAMGLFGWRRKRKNAALVGRSKHLKSSTLSSYLIRSIDNQRLPPL